jgi:hypothetical protein
LPRKVRTHPSHRFPDIDEYGSSGEIAFLEEGRISLVRPHATSFRRIYGGVNSTMHTVLIVAIVFGGIVLALAIIGSTVLMAVKIVRGGVSRKGQRSAAEEAKMIQEIYQGLSQMEERVETLETLILDSKGKDGVS